MAEAMWRAPARSGQTASGSAARSRRAAASGRSPSRRARAHTGLGEKIMREAGYDRYALDKEDHERLLDEIRDLMEAYEDRTGFDEAAFGARLGARFTVHIRTEDARLHKNPR